MANAAFLRHVAIGRYIPTGSLVHRLDPRAKLVSLVLLVAAAVIAADYVNSLVVLLAAGIIVALARLPAGQAFAAVRPVLPLVGVLALLQLLVGGRGATAGGALLWSWWFVRITSSSVQLVIVLALRLVSLVILAGLLTNTTTPGALTMGVERLLRPLRTLGLPSHEIALMGAIALRFLPILGEQMEAIVLAQDARGVGRSAGGRWRLLANAQRMAALVVPLFADVYRRAEEMAMAMLARCYRGGSGRTSLHELRYRPADAAALAFSLLVLGGVLALREAGLP